MPFFVPAGACAFANREGRVRRTLVRMAEKEAYGAFESEHPGCCGAQDTFYAGNLKGVGRVYQQTLIDTYARVAFAKLYDRKTPMQTFLDAKPLAKEKMIAA